MSGSTVSLTDFMLALKGPLITSLSTTATLWLLVCGFTSALTPSSSSQSPGDTLPAAKFTFEVCNEMTPSLPGDKWSNLSTLCIVDVLLMHEHDAPTISSTPSLQSQILLFIVQLLLAALLIRAYMVWSQAANNVMTLDRFIEWIPVGVCFAAMTVACAFVFYHSSITAILIFSNIGCISSVAGYYQCWCRCQRRRGTAHDTDSRIALKKCNVGVAIGTITILSALHVPLRYAAHYHSHTNFLIVLFAVLSQVVYVNVMKIWMDEGVQRADDEVMSKSAISTYNTLTALPLLAMLVAIFPYNSTIMSGVMMVLVVMVVEGGTLRMAVKLIAAIDLDGNGRWEISSATRRLLELSTNVSHTIIVAVGSVAVVMALSWALPPVYLLTLFQAMGVMLILGTWFASLDEDNRLSLCRFRECAGFTLLFIAMMLTSVLAFSYSVVLAALIFRNMDVVRTAAVSHQRVLSIRTGTNMRRDLTTNSMTTTTSNVSSYTSSIVCFTMTACVIIFPNWIVPCLVDVRLVFLLLAIIPPLCYKCAVIDKFSDSAARGSSRGFVPSTFCAASISSYIILVGVPVMMVFVCFVDGNTFSIEGAMTVFIALFGDPAAAPVCRAVGYITLKVRSRCQRANLRTEWRSGGTPATAREQRSAPECSICTETFNNNERRPCLCGACGNSICFTCAPSCRLCPYCRAAMPARPVANVALLHTVE